MVSIKTEWNKEDDSGNLNLAPRSALSRACGPQLQDQRGGWGITEVSDLGSVRSVVLELYKSLQ